MRYFIGAVSTGKVGSRREFEFQTDNAATEAEIEAAAYEAAMELVDWGFDEIKGKEPHEPG